MRAVSSTRMMTIVMSIGSGGGACPWGLLPFQKIVRKAAVGVREAKGGEPKSLKGVRLFA